MLLLFHSVLFQFVPLGNSVIIYFTKYLLFKRRIRLSGDNFAQTELVAYSNNRGNFPLLTKGNNKLFRNWYSSFLSLFFFCWGDSVAFINLAETFFEPQFRVHFSVARSCCSLDRNNYFWNVIQKLTSCEFWQSFPFHVHETFVLKATATVHIIHHGDIFNELEVYLNAIKN